MNMDAVCEENISSLLSFALITFFCLRTLSDFVVFFAQGKSQVCRMTRMKCEPLACSLQEAKPKECCRKCKGMHNVLQRFTLGIVKMIFQMV